MVTVKVMWFPVLIKDPLAYPSKFPRTGGGGAMTKRLKSPECEARVEAFQN
jgi:hypothetical protein